MSDAPPAGAADDAMRRLPWRAPLVCGASRGFWHWSERAHEEGVTNWIESWVYALRGSYKPGIELENGDLDRHDLIILTLSLDLLEHYARRLRGRDRTCTVVGLYDGDLAMLQKRWKTWSRVADRCDLIIATNRHGVSFMQAMTSAPVRYIGIPYPVDGIAAHRVGFEERDREIFLCAPPLDRPLDYLAARTLGLPMYTYEATFRRRPRELVRHRSLDKMHYLRRAAGLYNDPSLAILPRTQVDRYFERAGSSLFWMNLDPRYTWARYVLDAAALQMPIISTRETGHAADLFPDLLVDNPYDLAGAARLAERLRDDEPFRRSVASVAASKLDWYRPAATVERLVSAIGG